MPRGVGQLPHQGGSGGCFKDVEQLVFRGLRGPSQNIEVEVPTDDRRQRQHTLGVLSQSSDPGTNHDAHAVG